MRDGFTHQRSGNVSTPTFLTDLQILYVLHQDVFHRNHYISSRWSPQHLVVCPIDSQRSLSTGCRTIVSTSKMAQTFQILVHVLVGDRSCLP